MLSWFKNIILVLVLLGIGLPVYAEKNDGPPPQVLVLHSYHAGFSWTDAIQRGISQAFAEANLPVTTYVDYLDTKRNPSSDYLSKTVPTLLATKLQGVDFDLVLVSDNNAFNFALAHREDLLRGVPVVFCGVNYFQPGDVAGQTDVTGVAEYPSIYATLKVAKTLQPQLKNVIVVERGDGITANKNKQLLAAAEKKLSGALALTRWTDLPYDELTSRLKHVSADQAILLTSIVRGENGLLLDFPETAQLVSSLSPVPVYGLWDFFLSHGIVGGKLIDGQRQGRLAAELAIKILKGAPADKVPVIYDGANSYLFDQAALTRYGLDVDRVPKQSQLINQPTHFYEISTTTAKLTLALILCLFTLLFLFATSISFWRRSERAFRSQSSFLNSLLESLPLSIFYKNKEGVYTGCNRAMREVLGYNDSNFIGKTVEEIYPPDEAQVFRQADETLLAKGGTQIYEHKFSTADGRQLDVLFSKAVYHDANNNIAGIVGSILDVSERKRAQRDLQESERYNRALFEHSPLGLVVHQADGTIVDANSAFARVTGRELSQLIGSCLSELLQTAADKEQGAAFARAFDEGHYPSQEMVLRHFEGHVVPVRVAGVVTNQQDKPVLLSSVEDISPHKKAMQALAQKEELFRTTFETSPDAVCLTRLNDSAFVEVNKGFTDMTGYTRADVLNRSAVEIGLWVDGDAFKGLMCQLTENRSVSNFETRYCTKDGKRLTVLTSARIIEINGTLMVLSVVKNIESLVQYRKNLLESERKYRRIFDHIQDVYYESSLDGDILEISPSVNKNLFYSRQELLGTSFHSLYRDSDDREQFIHALFEQGKTNDYEIWLKDKNGTHRPCAVTSLLVKDDEGQPVKIVGSLRDITQRKEAEEAIRHLAYFDPLTGLPNRELFQERLHESLARLVETDEMVALLFLDLDRFKDINDNLGHSNGDLLLQGIAQRLQGCVGKKDTVARLGGDEFVLMLHGIKQPRDLVMTAQNVLKIIAQPAQLDLHETFTTASIGIVLAPEDGQNITLLMKHADMAMYAAKADGRNTYRFFSEEMRRKAIERHETEKSLRCAIKKDELFLEYQPQLDIKTNRIVGAEVLLRWQHPQWGRVSPANFVPVAEETGLISIIGEWVLEKACQQAQEWIERLGEPFNVAVNISGHQFKQPDFINMIELVLERTGLNPRHLELELTESILMDNMVATIATLTDLKNRGLQLAVDDFGTGYSSLSYLKNFPIDRVKIDQSFVADITAENPNAAIVETIIDMGHNLGLGVVAEGVENYQQYEFLKERQCDQMQGFLFERPLSATAMTKRLEQGIKAAEMASLQPFLFTG